MGQRRLRKLYMTTIRLLLLFMFVVCAEAQVASPTYNPFMNNGFQNGFQFSNNNGFQNNFQRPNNNGFQNNFQNGFQQSNNNGFQNNFQNGFQQSNNNNVMQSNPQLFTRRYHLNNGYLYGRPTLWYDAKSGKMVPWVRKNLR